MEQEEIKKWNFQKQHNNLNEKFYGWIKQTLNTATRKLMKITQGKINFDACTEKQHSVK